MAKYRMRYSKSERAIYSSNLDLMRTMQRAFSRAGHPLKYSEGFNPHPKISILAPLPVGCSGYCEFMDFELNAEADMETMPDELTAAMPEGLVVHEVYDNATKVTELKWFHVRGILEYDNHKPDEVIPGLEALFEESEIIIKKKTKRGYGDTDIKAGVYSVEFRQEADHVVIDAFLSAQEPTIGPGNLVDAIIQLRPELTPDFYEFARIEAYTKEMRIFR